MNEIKLTDLVQKLQSLPIKEWKFTSSDKSDRDRGEKITLFVYSTERDGFMFEICKKNKQTSHKCYDAAGEPAGYEPTEYNEYIMKVAEKGRILFNFENNNDVRDIFEEISIRFRKYKSEESNKRREEALSRLQAIIGGGK